MFIPDETKEVFIRIYSLRMYIHLRIEKRVHPGCHHREASTPKLDSAIYAVTYRRKLCSTLTVHLHHHCGIYRVDIKDQVLQFEVIQLTPYIDIKFYQTHIKQIQKVSKISRQKYF